MIMKNPRRQIFLFRWPIITYISKNPKVWKKLIKTCKYFFAQYPVYPVKQLTNFNGCWNADIRKTKTTQNISNLWIFDLFICDYPSGGPNTVSKILLKIVKCDLRYLHFSDQSLIWEEYQKLTSSGTIKRAFLFNSTFKYSDGKDVTMDKLLENLRNLEIFHFTFKSGSKMLEKESVKKIAELLSGFKNQPHFLFSNLDETFDLSSFMNFLLKNATIFLSLHYAYDLQFSVTYAQMLDTCFGELVAHPPKKLVNILIHGFESVKYLEYCRLRDGKI